MSWFRRNAQPKEDHPSTYPDTPARVDEHVKTRPVAFATDHSVIYPPQGFGSDVSDNSKLDIIVRQGKRVPVANPSIISEVYK